jgi:putative cell wall-binding protein
MKQGPSRFRRVATACAAGTIALSFLSVLGLSTPAFAATVGAGAGSYIHAPTAPNIAPGTTNSPAGNLQINLATGTTWATGDNITITVLDNLSAVRIAFAGSPVAAVTIPGTGTDQALCAGTGCPVTFPTSNSMQILLTGLVPQAVATSTPEQLTVSAIGYTTAANANTGPVLITAPGFTTGSGASNAVVATPPTIGAFVAGSTPIIPPGATTAAGPQVILLDGQNTTWATGDKIYITVARNNSLNCETVGRPDSVGFAGALPLVWATVAQNGATAVPTLTASYATGAGSSCASFSGVNNVMVLTFTNSGSITALSMTTPITITIFGVSYAVSADIGDGSAALPNTNNLGNVATGISYNVLPTYQTSGFGVANDMLLTPTPDNLGAPYHPSNANININNVVVTANHPSTTLQFNKTATGSEVVNQAVSPISIAEGSPGALSSGVTGWACIALSPGAGTGNAAEFNALPTVTATGGGIAIGGATLLTPGGQSGPTELAFQVTTGSSGTPGTVTVSGITINFPTTLSTMVANLWYGASSAAYACESADTSGGTVSGGGTGYDNNPFTVANLAGRIFGQVQDGTAAQVFENNKPGCTTGVPSDSNETPAILVTNASYQDALSASYLAGQFSTGILTTPVNTVSADALNALRIDGVTQVFVVGGPLVVSPADITQLQNTPAFNCGGASQRTNLLGQPVDLVVQQIYGQTADGTAAAVATYNGPKLPGTGDFPGAYGGSYNDTTGSNGSAASSAPDTPVTTAILATDNAFQDAASASSVAYSGDAQPGKGNGFGFPLLLTPQGSLSPDAAAALTNLAVQQVIVMGGPIAISDTVLTQIQAMGISVLRIAGQDFTDTSQLLGRFDLNSVVPFGTAAGQANGLDYDPLALTVARGDYYTDAIVASRASSHQPILLTWDPNNEGNPAGTNYLGTFLTAAGQGNGLDLGSRPLDPTINNLLFIGGPFAISNALAAAIGHSLNG